MKEQRAAKLLAEEQTEQRRKAALERKATLDAEIAARADVRQAKAAHAAAAQAEALAATAAAAAATAAEQAEAAANHQVEAAAASAAAAVEVEAAATRSANDEHETAQLLRMQAELDAATAVLEDETAAAVEAAFTAAATAVAATETMPAPTASELAPEGPGREPPLHATSEMDSWSESHPGVAAAAIADTAAAVTEAEPEPEAVSAAVEVAPGGPHGQEAPLHVTMSEVDSHPDRGLTSDRTPVPGLAPDPEPHAGAEQPAEQLQNLGAPPEAGVEAGAAEADARAEEAAGGGAGGAEGFLSEGEQEAPVKEVVAVDEAEVGPGTPPEGVPSSAVGAAAAEEGQEDAELAAALLELQLSPRQETGAAPPEGDSAAAALPLGSMDGAQLDAELQPQSAAPTPRPSTEGEQRRLEACAQSEAALSTAQSAARKAEVERQRVAAELEQHKRAQDEAGRSKPKGGLRSVLGFNKKRAKAAQELSAARTAELGSRLEQLKLEAEAAAEAETRVEDEHRQVQERLTLERKGSLARARAAADQAAEVAAAQAAEVSALEGQDAGTDAGADASADAGADAGAGELAGAMQTAEAPPLPEAAHGNNVPAEESADAGDEETEDESEDSDFLHSAREPPAAPLLKGLVNMAKLYGYEDSLPSNFDLERARCRDARRFAPPGLAPASPRLASPASPSTAHQRRVRLRATASARGRRASMAHADARCTVARRRSFGGSRRRGGRARVDRPESDQVVPPLGRWARACHCGRGQVPLALFRLKIFGRSRAVAPRDPR